MRKVDAWEEVKIDQKGFTEIHIRRPGRTKKKGGRGRAEDTHEDEVAELPETNTGAITFKPEVGVFGELVSGLVGWPALTLGPEARWKNFENFAEW